MKINQAAELAGITSKNIRFYEDQGLIKPGRDPQNGYRDYSLDDTEQLKRIRLLRQLGIPCESIRRLETGELDFDSCMAEHVLRLEGEGRNIEHMKTICEMLSNDVDDISEIRASVYLDKMKELEKGGVRFMNVKTSDVKKRRTGAILAAGFVILMMLIILGLVIWANNEDPAPIGILILVIVTCAGIVIGVGAALRQRLVELKKGEIDEAVKY